MGFQCSAIFRPYSVLFVVVLDLTDTNTEGMLLETDAISGEANP